MRKVYLHEQALKLLLEVMSVDDIYKKYYSDIPSNDFNKIVQADPTWNQDKPEKMGKYTKWLLKLYTLNKLKVEDLYKATEYLTYFSKYQRQIDVKDIGQYDSLPSLFLAVKPFMENPDRPTSHKDEIRRIKEGAEKVYEDDEWLIIIPHTKEASCYYGKGTQWCTAAEKSNNLFYEYNEEGPLYININKTNNTKYQFHFQSKSFMDESDDEINKPIVDAIGLSEGAQNWYIENVPNSNLLFEEIIPFLTDEYDDNYFYLAHNSYLKTYQLYYKHKPIGCNILPLSHEAYYRECKNLRTRHFGLFNNVNGKKTLILLNYYMEIVLYSDNIEQASNITNEDVYTDGGSILSVINNGKYEIISTDEGGAIFIKNDASKVLYTMHVACNDKCLTIFRNGEAILYDGEYETDPFKIDKDMLFKNICSDDYDDDYIVVRISKDRSLVFDEWTLELKDEIKDR